MLSKCANPSCSTQLIYLREGKIFVMEHTGKPKLRPPGPVLPSSASHLEHFWLCGTCSESLTLVYDPERGVQVIPKELKVRRSAAS